MKKERNAPVWVKVLVLLHAFLITSWSLPRSAPAVQRGMAQPKGSDWIIYYNDRFLKGMEQGQHKGNWLYKNYMFTTGLWQSWDMFSPNPSNLDIWADAEIDYEDGSTKRYQYPRVYNLSHPEKFVKERYRKFFERVNPETAEWLWPTYCQRLALEAYKPGGPKPVRVRAWKHYRVAPKPLTIGDYWAFLKASQQGQGIGLRELVPPQMPMPKEYTSVMFYEHTVDQAVLARAAAR